MNPSYSRFRRVGQAVTALFLLALAWSCSDDQPLPTVAAHARIDLMLWNGVGNGAEVTVCALDDSGRTVAKTDSRGGRAELYLQAGSYRLRVGNGFVSGGRIVRAGDEAEVFQLQAEEDVEVTAFFGALRVSLRDDAGDLVPWTRSSRLQLESTDGSSPFLPSGYLEGNELVLPGLPIASYLCSYRADGERLTTWYPAGMTMEEAKPVLIESQQTQSIELRYRPGAFVELEVETPLPDEFTLVLTGGSDDDNVRVRPLSTHRVLVGPSLPYTEISIRLTLVWTDKAGNFGRLLNVPVSLTSGDFGTTVLAELEFHGIEVLDAGCGAGCGQRLIADSSLEVDLRCENRGSRQGPTWVLFPDRGDREIELYSDPNDDYSLSTHWPGVLDPSEAESISLATGENRAVSFPRLEDTYVRGRLLDEDGQPLPQSARSGIRIELPQFDHANVRGSVESDGSYLIRGLPRGTVWIRVVPTENSGFLATYYGDTEFESERQIIEVDFGEKHHGFDIRLRRKP